MMDANTEQNIDLRKFPFKRIKYAVNQVVKTGIPLHLRVLKATSENLDNLKKQNRPLELHAEQVRATRIIELLKTDLFELDMLHLKVMDEDQELFQQMIEIPLKDAIDALSDFTCHHSDVLGPLSDIEDEPTDNARDFPELKCDWDAESEPSSQCVTQLKITPICVETSLPPSVGWSLLRGELIEIHSIIRKFSTFVFSQQESVNSVQSNVVESHENVKVGNEYLRKATLLKAASFPFAGAVIGGLVMGPIGALVGLKLFGSVACMAGGSALGYGSGLRLKKKQQALCDIEMKALTYPSKSTSCSNPELSVCTESKKKS